MYFTWHNEESLKYNLNLYNFYKDSYYKDTDLVEYLFKQTGLVKNEIERWLDTGEIPVTRDITIDAKHVPGRKRIL